MNCGLCNKELKNTKALAMHINKEHPETTKEEYFIKYLSVNNEHICSVCGGPNKFMGIAKRYPTNCSQKCAWGNPDYIKKVHDGNMKKYGTIYGLSSDIVKDKVKKSNLEKYGVDNTFKLKTTQDKIKVTIKEKYGVDNVSQNEEIKDKKSQTCLEHFGVDHHFKWGAIKDKIKQTNLDTYGVENPRQSPIIAEKIKNTNLEKYGVEHAFQAESVKEKIVNTNLDRYGVNYAMSLESTIKKTEETNMKRYGVKRTSQDPTVKAKIVKSILQTSYQKLITKPAITNKVSILFTEEEYKGTDKEFVYPFKCNKCEQEFTDHLDSSKIPRCLTCYPISSGTSIIEQEIYNHVRSVLPDHIQVLQNDRTVIAPLELDIVVPEYKFAIEFDGLYWHTELQGKDKYYHRNKTDLCTAAGYEVIHIFENEWLNSPEIIKSMICNKLKLNSVKIPARKCQVKISDVKESKLFIEENHIQGYVPCKHRYGLYYKDELVAVLTTGVSRFNKKYDYEILRYCSKLNTNVLGGFSKLLKHFQNENPGSVITYSDLRYGAGGVYEKSGFTKLTRSAPNYFYTNDYISLASRNKFQKHKLINLLETFDPELTEWQNMVKNNYDRIWDCGNNVFGMSI